MNIKLKFLIYLNKYLAILMFSFFLRKIIIYNQKIRILLSINKQNKILGKFKNFNSAIRSSKSSYKEENIFNKVKNSSLIVKNNIFPYQRDSIFFEKIPYNKNLYRIFSILKKKYQTINVLDYGGSFGNVYNQVNSFFGQIYLNWNIIEQKHYVKFAKKNFQNKNLKFFYDLNKIRQKIHLILFSNSLQYLKEPYKTLSVLADRSFDYICIDSIPLSGVPEYVSNEIPPNYIYNCSYPIWILNKKELVSFINEKNYILVNYKILNYSISGIKYYFLLFKKT
jgi:putative methyltransferase (TIGR04325 family)